MISCLGPSFGSGHVSISGTLSALDSVPVLDLVGFPDPIRLLNPDSILDQVRFLDSFPVLNPHPIPYLNSDPVPFLDLVFYSVSGLTSDFGKFLNDACIISRFSDHFYTTLRKKCLFQIWMICI